jgi:DNA replication protein DnaC
MRNIFLKKGDHPHFLNWHDHIGDPTIADAILDRLIHNGHQIQLKEESMRKKQKLDTN